MQVFLINKSSDALSYLAGTVVVPPTGQIEATSDNWFGLYTDAAFLKDIRLNNVQISDGTTVYEYPKSEEFIAYANSFNYNNRDIDGAMIVRTKAAKKGWSFWAIPIEFTTSTLGGTIYCKTSDGNNIPWISCRIYDVNNVEIVDAQNLGVCVKTVIDFEPTFDFEIIGGSLRVHENPATDIRLWIVGAPDIPAQFGGSKEFASGVNLKFMAPNASFDIDGRVTKYLTYNPVTHQGKMRIIIKHPPGTPVNIQALIHIYRL